MKNYLTIVGLVLSLSCLAQTTYQGTISDEETGEALLFSTIAFYNNDIIVAGTETNLDGDFQITLKEDFTHVELQYLGYSPRTILKKDFYPSFNDLSMSPGVMLNTIVIQCYGYKYDCPPGCILTCEIRNSECFTDQNKSTLREKKTFTQREGNDWIYPNPTNGITNIKDEIIEKYSHYSLLNSAGQVVLSTKPIQHEIDLTMLQEGCYNLIAENDKEQKIIKLIKFE
jgi:hypothetical protein